MNGIEVHRKDTLNVQGFCPEHTTESLQNRQISGAEGRYITACAERGTPKESTLMSFASRLAPVLDIANATGGPTFNKVTSVFHASVPLLITNFVITVIIKVTGSTSDSRDNRDRLL